MKRRFDENTPHILIVDDDTRIRKLLQKFLLEHGFRVSSACDAQDAQNKMNVMEFDTLVLDVMMPGIDGLAFIQKLRRKNNQVPILLLTARGEVEQRIIGLRRGADDYLPKPFVPEELLLRLQNLLKRNAITHSAYTQGESLPDLICFGEFSYYFQRDALRHRDKHVPLTTNETTIIRKLARAYGRAVARAELLSDDDHSERAIDVQINRLRAKIEYNPREPIFIQTVRGIGYILRADTP